MSNRPTRPATAKQCEFLASLLAERGCHSMADVESIAAEFDATRDPGVENHPDAGAAYAVVGAGFAFYEHSESLTTVGASANIDRLLATPRRRPTTDPAAANAPTGDAPEGVHLHGGEYIKVQTSRSGNLYAKVWEDFGGGDGEWQYVGGGKSLWGLTDATLLDAEQAAAFGHLYGTCVFCSATLTDERSIFVGYGPTCADNHGLPWGDRPTVEAPDPNDDLAGVW